MKAGRHLARKRFGQHFLTDAAVLDAIVQAIDPQPGEAMVEIGPGLAALTQPLLARLGRLTVIELDRDLAEHLRRQPALQVLQADVLKVDFALVAASLTAIKSGANESERNSAAAVVPARLRLVGNLPYNISTPILFHLLPFAERVIDQHFMLQKEVVQRMVAQPGTASYGRLSVMLQWRYAMELLLEVPPQSFAPPPRVDSALVRMRPHRVAPEINLQRLQTLVQVAFSQRRKLLRHTLGAWLEQQNFAGAFDLQRRAEEVPVTQYLALAQQLPPAALQVDDSQ